MKKVVRGKVTAVTRKAITGLGSNIAADHKYDDNVIQAKVQITQGPDAWLDRVVTAEIGISDFVNKLPDEVAKRLLHDLYDAVGWVGMFDAKRKES
jgi:hypothetical protein